MGDLTVACNPVIIVSIRISSFCSDTSELDIIIIILQEHTNPAALCRHVHGLHASLWQMLLSKATYNWRTTWKFQSSRRPWCKHVFSIDARELAMHRKSKLSVSHWDVNVSATTMWKGPAGSQSFSDISWNKHNIVWEATEWSSV